MKFPVLLAALVFSSSAFAFESFSTGDKVVLERAYACETKLQSVFLASDAKMELKIALIDSGACVPTPQNTLFVLDRVTPYRGYEMARVHAVGSNSLWWIPYAAMKRP